jgi:hypothetical protein
MYGLPVVPNEYRKRWVPKMSNVKNKNVKITGGIDRRQTGGRMPPQQ